MIETLPPEDVKWDYVSGVSIGSLIASWFSLHPVGKEKEAIAELVGMFAKLTPDKFWKFWPWYIVEPFFKQSLVNNDGFSDVLDEYFGDR